MRRTIGRHMVKSLQVAAQTTTVVEADMTEVEAARRAAGVTALAFTAHATVETLADFPQLNATLDDELLTVYDTVNLGIAVSLGDDGLIVPVIAGAERLDVAGVAAAIADVAGRARARELTLDDVEGGTFTISNTGAFGSLLNTPIINQPQVAILNTEAIVRRPVVVTGDDGAETIAIRSIANLCLTWDHRVVDGALAAQFLGALRRRVEAGSAPMSA
jgi:pyruvate/2-oxoglutarate dehydrogenase complex dihydrolipoamide acyltransferase (E2) component